MFATTPSPEQGLIRSAQDETPGDEPPPDIAALALQFAESLELPIVLDQVARQLATLFSCVCQVRFTPAQRPADARSVVADPHTQPSASSGTGGDASAATLLTRLGSPGATLLFVPLIARGRRIGMIDLVLPASDDTHVQCDQALLRLLARSAALAIDTADQVARLQSPTGSSAPAEPGADLDLALALITHDLRNSLAVLRSSLQLLGRLIGDAQEPDRNQVMRIVTHAEAAAGQLEVQIQALAPEAITRPPPSDTPVAFVDLVRAARLMANFYQQTTARHQISVTTLVPELLGPWSRLQLERMLGNLLLNAIKYSAPGGAIRVSVGREDDTRGSWATLSVQNDGIGIPPAELGRLTRAGRHTSNADAISGAGFGLTSVREVVAQCGGTFAIESKVGGSTTILIRLPLE